MGRRRILLLLSVTAAFILACAAGAGQNLLPEGEQEQFPAGEGQNLLQEGEDETGRQVDVAPAVEARQESTTEPVPVTAEVTETPQRQATAVPERGAQPLVYQSDPNPCVRREPDGRGAGIGQDFLEEFGAGDAVLVQLRGHSNPPYYAAFSPDGRAAVSAAQGEVRLWEVTTGRMLRELLAQSSFGVPAFSPDGSLLATRLAERRIRLWDAATGAIVHDLDVGMETVLADGYTSTGPMRFSPDGRHIAVAVGRVIVLVDAVTGATVGELAGEEFGEDEDGASLIGNGHAGYVTSLAYSADARVLLGADDAGTLWLWDVNTGHPVRCFEPDAAVTQVVMSPDGRTAAALAYSLIFFWDAVNGGLLDEWRVAPTGSIQFHPDGTAILVTMEDHSARIYDVRTGRLQSLLRHPQPVSSAEFSPDGGRVITTIGSDSDDVADPIYEAWIWDAQHPDLALAAAAQILIDDGVYRAIAGNIAAARQSFERAQALNPQPEAEFPAYYWNILCWYGSLWQQAAAVMPACELAVGLPSNEEDHAAFRDSRGVARSLMGDYKGAIEDFAAFVTVFDSYSYWAEEVAQRREWIAALQAGRSPFDEATLAALREE
jgi:WD40 repeat protein